MKTLLDRLDAELAEVRDSESWVKLQAKKAAHFARVGRFLEAKRIVEALRGKHAGDTEGEGVVWVMYAEGLIHFFESYDDRAHDRLFRARLLADAFALEDIKVLALAWLTHIEFNRARYGAVSMLLGDMRDLNVKSDHSSPEFARISLTLGDVAAYCGESDLSRYWYAQARQCAVAQGDDATTAAVLYNKPAMSLFGLRLALAAQSLDAESVRFVTMEMEAAHGYQVGARHGAQSQLLFSCQARLHLLAGEYIQAASLFGRILSESDLTFGFVSDLELLKLEHAFSLAMTGNVASAGAIFCQLNSDLSRDLNADDEMIFCHFYPKVAGLLDLPCDEFHWSQRYDLAAKKLASEQELLRANFFSLSDHLKRQLVN
jgi:hypothetical protein